MLDMFKTARLRGVPIVAINTADQAQTIDAVVGLFKDHTMLQWDAARGITPTGAIDADGKKSPAYVRGEKIMERVGIRSDETVAFVNAMLAAQLLPRATVLFAHNAHRQLQSMDPGATASAVQAVANLRDAFKKDFRMLVLLAPSMTPPAEIAHDIVVLSDPLPDTATLKTIVEELSESAASASKKFEKPTGEVLTRAVDAVAGLSAFEAEQVLAMSLTDTKLDVPAAWERKRVTIEQTPGMSVYRGKGTFDDLRGLDSIKTRLRSFVKAKTPLGVIVWIDEGADVFQNVEHDTSGVKTDQQRALLVEMENNGWRGVILVGVPGSGKSEIARTFGNEAGVPTIAVDFAGMESKYVGDSEANLRKALDVIKAVGRGNAFFVLTCNSLKGIRPQFMRRFKRGTFFFDLPTPDERDAIWSLYEKKFQIAKQSRPDDDGWTGAEIRECCESAWDVGNTLTESAKFIVPVSRSRASEIEAMRAEAHNRFLDASHPGTYTYDKKPMAKQLRAVSLGNDVPAIDASGLKRKDN